jgi:methyl-accepting chemotaxis protein
MVRLLKFKTKLAIGFLGTILAAVIIFAISLYALRVNNKNHNMVISDYSHDLIESGRLRANEEEIVASSRGYLISGDPIYLNKMESTRKKFLTIFNELKMQNQSSEEIRLLENIELADHAHLEVLNHAIESHQRGISIKNLIRKFEVDIQPRRQDLEQAVLAYNNYAKIQLENGKSKLIEITNQIFWLLIIVSSIALLMAITLALVITRILSRLYDEAKQAVRARYCLSRFEESFDSYSTKFPNIAKI